MVNNWNVGLLGKKDRGLKIRNLYALNKALRGKWNWRFATKTESLWKQIIIGKSGDEDEGWCSRGVRGGHGVGMWKSIKHKWEIIKGRSRFLLGNGRKVQFWKDLWCEDQTLEEVFPNVFSFIYNKEEWVVEAREVDREGGGWSHRFSR